MADTSVRHIEGWALSDVSKLDDDDAHFLMLLQTENGPLSLDDHPWRKEGVPSGPAHPVLALPILVRRELAASVFYGAHAHGEALDPDEVRAIAGLATGAAAAYDHLEADVLKRTVDTMTSEIESLRRQLAQTKIQPAELRLLSPRHGFAALSGRFRMVEGSWRIGSRIRERLEGASMMVEARKQTLSTDWRGNANVSKMLAATYRAQLR